MKNKITVSIAGQTYTLVASEESGYMEKVAAHVDAKIQEVIRKNVQLRAERLAAAADAAGLDDKTPIRISDYGRSMTAGELREWAAGRFGPDDRLYPSTLDARDFSDPAKLAEELGCSTDYLLGVEPLNTVNVTGLDERDVAILAELADRLFEQASGLGARLELEEVLAGCDAEQSRVILAVARAARAALKGYRVGGAGQSEPAP